MADTMDRRAEGKTTTPKGLRARAKREAHRAAGLCTICGITPVKGRATCYACGDKGKPDKIRSLVKNNSEIAIKKLEEMGYTITRKA